MPQCRQYPETGGGGQHDVRTEASMEERAGSVAVKNGDLYDMHAVLKRCASLKPARLVIARPYDTASMEAAAIVSREQVARPMLVGSSKTMGELIDKLCIEKNLFEFVDAADDRILERGASMLHDREADFIMKGLVGTGDFIHVLLDPRWRVRTDRILSHIAMLEIPETKRVILMSDGAINILPNFSRKIQIVRNAVDAARRIGIRQVRVAMLAAVEKVKLPAMPATLDAFLMKKYAETGRFGDCIVDGPFAFDNAIDYEKAAEKGIGGRVAGRANVIIVPNIETGNVIWKTITCFQRGPAAGVVLGGSCPIVVPSRADDTKTKVMSIKFARLLLGF